MAQAQDNSNDVLLWAGLIGLGGALLYFGKGTKREFTARDAARQRTEYAHGIRAEIVRVTMRGQWVQLHLSIDNPNTTDVVLRSLVGDLYINQVKVANVAWYGETTIRGNHNTRLTVEAKLKILNAIAEAMALLQGQTAGTTVTFIGTMNVNNNPEQLNIRYKLG